MENDIKKYLNYAVFICYDDAFAYALEDGLQIHEEKTEDNELCYVVY